MHGDDFCNGTCSDAQCVVGFLECGAYGEFGIDFAKFFVVDDEQSVHFLAYGIHSVECLVDFLVPFEPEGYGDNAYGKYAFFLGFVCDDRCGSRSGSSAHSGGDENHFRAVVKHGAYAFDAFFCGSLGTCRTVSCAESFVAELQAYGYRTVGQRFAVRIADHEIHIVDAGAVHVVDSVSAATAHTDDFDYFRRRCGNSHVDDKIFFHKRLVLFVKGVLVSPSICCRGKAIVVSLCPFCLRNLLQVRKRWTQGFPWFCSIKI